MNINETDILVWKLWNLTTPYGYHKLTKMDIKNVLGISRQAVYNSLKKWELLAKEPERFEALVTSLERKPDGR